MTLQIKQPGFRLQEETLAEFERKHGFLLPTTYRAFLLQHNGGTPQPSSYCRKRNKKPLEVCRHFFGLQSGRSNAEMEDALETYLGEDETRIPRRLLPIAEDPFGNLICLSLRGEGTGKVYFWHHEEELNQKRTKTGDVNDAAISLIADSFDAFLTQFAESKDDQKARLNRCSWHELIATGDRAGVEAWLDAGGDMSERDSSDFHTPISLAVAEEQQEIVDLLLDRGLDPAEALKAAANAANWPFIKRIVEHPKGKPMKMEPWIFQITLDDCDEVSVIEALLDAGAPLHATFQRGNALFHATESVADPAIISLLLKRGAEAGVPGYLGRLPLSCAIVCGKFETAKLLMDAGENLYFQPHHVDQWGQTHNYGPLEHLNNPLERIRAIKSAVLEYAKSLGHTADNDAPRAKRKG
jgi:ankyrin repeat protein